MPEQIDETPKADVSAESRKRGYEASTITVRGLGIFLALFCVGGVVIQIGVWILLKFYMAERRNADVPKSAVERVERAIEPSLQPSPAHDTTPPQDLATMHEAENRVFAHMGWEIDSDSGEARIPGQIAITLESRRIAPSTHPVLDSYEIPYVPSTQPTGVTPTFGPQTTTPPPPYPSTQPGGQAR